VGAEQKEHWHLRKEITWGHIMTTVSLLMAASVAWMDLNTDVQKNIQAIDYNRQSIERSSEQNQRDRQDINNRLQRMDGKIDKLLEIQLRSNGR